jgi:hypothetical protein
VVDRDGNIVGGGTRAINAASMGTVSHAGFALDRGVQGQGFMTRYNAQAEQSYRDHGISQITIHASGGNAGGMQFVGGYAWARAGYDFAPTSRADVAARWGSTKATGDASRYPPEVRAKIAKVASDPAASPLDYAMIGWTPGATMWPGKEIMLDTSWDGVKDL